MPAGGEGGGGGGGRERGERGEKGEVVAVEGGGGVQANELQDLPPFSNVS
jgi:hypothetical protein